MKAHHKVGSAKSTLCETSASRHEAEIFVLGYHVSEMSAFNTEETQASDSKLHHLLSRPMHALSVRLQSYSLKVRAVTNPTRTSLCISTSL